MDNLHIPHFDTTDTSTLAPRWTTWVEDFEFAMTGFNITANKRKRALLLHYGGPNVKSTFRGLANAGIDVGDENDYKKALDALTAEFAPQRNKIVESIKFRRQKQLPEESIAQYCTRLRDLAATCDFHDTNREILTQIILSCTSNTLRKWALEKEIQLKDLLDKARALELSRQHAREIEGNSNNSQPQERDYVNKVSSTDRQQFQRSKKTCFACGGDFPHGETPCPATGRKCYNCGGLGHLAKVCRSKKKEKQQQETPAAVNLVTSGLQDGGAASNAAIAEPHDESDSEEGYVF